MQRAVSLFKFFSDFPDATHSVHTSFHSSISYSAILSVKASVCDPFLPLFDHLAGPGQILSTDGGVLIVDQICLVIPDPRRFPDVNHPLHFHRTSWNRSWLVKSFARGPSSSPPLRL